MGNVSSEFSQISDHISQMNIEWWPWYFYLGMCHYLELYSIHLMMSHWRIQIFGYSFMTRQHALWYLYVPDQ